MTACRKAQSGMETRTGEQSYRERARLPSCQAAELPNAGDGDCNCNCKNRACSDDGTRRLLTDDEGGWRPKQRVALETAVHRGANDDGGNGADGGADICSGANAARIDAKTALERRPERDATVPPVR